MTPADVVLVDDVPIERTLARLAIERSGRFRVVGEGADGAEAITLTTELRPALVVLDLSMPNVDGLEALATIKREAPGTCVVVLSGLSTGTAAATARALGADDYIEKGLHPDELVARLDAALGPAAGGV